MQASVTKIIRREGHAHQEDRTNNVRSDGVEIGLNRRISEACDDLWKEVGDREQRNTKRHADNHVERPEAICFENRDSATEVELRVRLNRRVCCNTVVGEFLLILRQEVGRRCRLRQDEQCDKAHCKCQGPFDQEQVLPTVNTTVDSKDSERYKAGESPSNLGSGIVDTEASGKLTSSVES